MISTDEKITAPALKTVLARLWKYLYRYKWLLAAAFVMTLAGNLLALAGPRLSGYAIEALEPGKGRVDFDKVFYYCAVMAVFYAVSALLSYALSLLMIKLSQKVAYTIREDAFNKLADLPVGYFDRFQTGDIISRITYDVDVINASLSSDLIQLSASVITVVGSLAMMLTISPPMLLVFALTVPASILFTKYRTKKVKPLFKERSVKLGELNGFVEEKISGQKTVKAYNAEETMKSRFENKNDLAVEAYYRAEYLGSMVGPSVNFINNISMAMVSVLGTILYLYAMISIGDVSAFILYSRKFSGPINEAANIVTDLQSAVAAAERVFRLIDEKPEPADAPDAREVEDPQGDVALEDVSFGYNGGPQVIRHLSLEAKKGALVAIVGPTGAGKTTIVNLLMRFYDADSGVIRLDGLDIRGVTRKSLRLSYALVLQDTWLFEASVFDNIAYAKQGATRQEVEDAARLAGIHEFIAGLPKGYDTVLGGDGSDISAGQKQLITIARAMLMDTSLLILDEATSSVDTRTELQVQAAMKKLMRDKTCFVIAHRLSTVREADTILVVNNGEIVEQGSHEELLEHGGMYAGLFNAQFDGCAG
ncbi:MAG TPA: ABC transporter ATP-binding protein [Clostridiales bacterium]|nr:MAG: putative ABC transporter ATP-binding protein [Firmicutes bacterium ADurb.Bin262]HOU09936.1 ABC transporter ATP-binding protein [Clostridiales bacterium]HQH62234.1 ABC transporter ATP-binding protein [Clostridiales bacterium]HQK73180.1 ABC transporter ATP-binding protein [Clostridiales bacterium]